MIKRAIKLLLITGLTLFTSKNYAQCTELFISEYIEGAGLDKSIEIYNPTNATVNLTGYSLRKYINGGGVAFDTLVLSGTIAPHDVFVVSNGGSDPAILAETDLQSGFMSFNGNDAVGLFNGSTMIDLIGVIGQDPGPAGWTGSGASTFDQVLVRKFSINAGVTTNPGSFDPSVEYDNYAVNDFTHLGSHSSVCAVCLYRDTNTVDICSFDSIFFGGNYLDLPGTYHDTVSGTCDTIHTLVLDTFPPVEPEMVLIPFNTVICYGDIANIASLSAYEGLYPSYQWYKNGVPFGPDTNDLFIPYDSLVDGDTFWCELTSSNPCAVPQTVNSDTVTLTKSALTPPAITRVGGTLIATTTPMDAGYQWLENNVVLTNDTNSTLVYPGSGTDCYKIEVIDSLVCVVESAPYCLTCGPTIYDTIQDTICTTDSLLFGGNYYNLPGSYNDTLQNGSGCDSIVTLELATKTCGVTPCSELFFSEYIEGSSNNKALEIYNPTPSVVYLTGYEVRIYVNGGTSPLYTIPLTDSINPHDVFILSHSSAAPALLSLADQTSGSMQFNGDDAVALFNGSTMVDLIGEIGFDPGADWNLGGVSTLNKTLVRQNTVDVGVHTNPTSFNPSTEWIQFAQDVFYKLDEHTSICKTCTNVYDTIADTICANDSLLFGSSYVNVAGSYNDTLALGNGCDSIVTLNLTVKPISIFQIFDTICSGDSVLFASVYRKNSGYYYDTLVNSVGCDSLNEFILTVYPTKFTNLSDSLCAGDTIFFGGDTITMAGLYKDTLSTINGCDSIISINVTNKNFCGNGPCQEIFISEYVEGSGNNKALELYNPTNDSVDLSQYQIRVFANGNNFPSVTITMSGFLQSKAVFVIADPSATAPFTSVADQLQGLGFNGNDAILLIKGTDTVDIFGEIGDDPGAPGWFSQTTDRTLVRKSGVNAGIQNNPALFDPSIEWNINPIDDASDLGMHVSICDSCLVLYDTVNSTICAGDSVLFGSTYYKLAGSYNDTTTASTSCDSITTLNLAVLNSPVVNLTDSICAGDSIFFGGVYYKVSGSYADTGTAANTCDSITNLTLTVLPSPFTTKTDSLCVGDTITFGGKSVTYAGVFYDTVALPSGCDSITELTVTYKSTCTPIPCDQLFFSEYIEGSGNNKALEIYNPTGNVISLNGYFIERYSNGGTSPVLIPLAGSINPYDVYLVANPSSVSPLIDSADLTSGSLNFNGDDALALSYNGFIIDIIGKIGQDPGTEWNVGGVTTLNNTLRRKATIQQGVWTNPVTFDPSLEWNSFGNDNFSGIGFHINSCSPCITQYDTISNSICQGDSISFGGSFYKVAGLYNDTLSNVISCDSIVTLNLTVNPLPIVNITDSICAGDSLLFGGTYYKVSGTYSDTTTSSLSCDSITNLALTVLPNSLTNLTDSICAGDSLLFGGTYYKLTGTYSDTVASANGCDSVINLALTVLPNSVTNLTDSICAGDSLLFGGTYYKLTGTYSDTVASANGCDSVINLALTVLPNSVTNLTDSICAGDSLLFAGTYYKLTGTYSDTVASGNGCDSIINLALTVLPNSVTNLTDSICAGDSLLFAGTYYKLTGTYSDTVASANGCDSVINLALTVLPNSVTNLTDSICAGDSLLFAGTYYKLTGTYSDTLASANGCDSIINLALTVLPNSVTNLTDSICSGDSLLFAGTYYKLAGTYSDTLTSGNGCDSIINLTLTVLPNSVTNLTDSLCLGDTILFAGQNIVAVGNYADTVTSVNGCDSIINLTVTYKSTCVATPCDYLFISEYVEGSSNNKAIEIYNPTNASINLNGYNLERYSNGGTVPTLIPLSGTIAPYDVFVVTNTLANSPLIDSADLTSAQLNFNGNDAVALSYNGFILDIIGKIGENPGTEWSAGGNTTLDNTMRRKATVQFGVWTNPASFDPSVEWDSLGLDNFSGIGYHISVCTPCVTDYDTITDTICDGDSLLFGGNYLTIAGSYNDTLTNMMTCDSIVTLNLTVNSGALVNLSDSICSGDSLLFAGTYYKLTGTYADTVVGSNGCDSITNLALTVLPLDTVNLVDSICTGDSIFFGGVYITSAGTYYDTASGTYGCDSLTVLTLTISNTIVANISDSICAGDSLFFAGKYYSLAGNYADTTTSSGGCDSITNLTLSVLPIKTSTISDSICVGDSLLFGGNYLTTSGTYMDTLSSSNGCDSIVTLTLTYKGGALVNLTDSICAGDSLLFAGTYYKLSGTYSDTVAGSGGCDSITNLTLTVLPTQMTNLVDSICAGDSIFFGGVYLKNPGTYNDTVSSTQGCDSIVTLTLTIGSGKLVNLTDSICEGDSIFFAGTYYNMSGTYSDTVSIGSCDSITNLTLTVLVNDTTNLFDTICQGDSVIFAGTSVKLSGKYYDTLTNMSGCDSIVILDLTVLLSPVVNLTDSICAGDSVLFAGVYYNASGTYSDTVTAANGCDSITNLTLTVFPVQTTNISDSICAGDSILFGGNYLTAAGTYMDTLSTSIGCDSIVTLTLSIKAFNYVTLNDSLCPGDSILFAGTYLTTPGTYYDTVAGSTSCDTLITLNLANRTTALPTIAISASNSIICAYQSVTFTSNITNGGATPQYQWRVNGVNVGTGATFISASGQFNSGDVVTCYLVSSLSCANPDTVYSNAITMTVSGSTIDTVKDTICQNDYYVLGGDTLTTSGVYYDTVVSGTGCDSITRLELDVLPVPIVVANSDVDTIVVGGTVNFTPNGSNASNYLWDFGDGNSSTLNTVSHTYNTPGVYTVVLTGDLLFGCSSTDTLTIVVINNVGVEELGKLYNLNVYPNPTVGKVTISFDNPDRENTTIILYSPEGKLVKTQSTSDDKSSMEFDLTDMERGVYFIQLNNKAVQISRRLIKLD